MSLFKIVYSSIILEEFFSQVRCYGYFLFELSFSLYTFRCFFCDCLLKYFFYTNFFYFKRQIYNNTISRFIHLHSVNAPFKKIVVLPAFLSKQRHITSALLPKDFKSRFLVSTKLWHLESYKTSVPTWKLEYNELKIDRHTLIKANFALFDVNFKS